MISGYGAQNCGKFVSLPPYKQEQFLIYALGFIDGATNMAGASHKLEGREGDSFMVWLKNYCNKEPLDQFALAVASLVGELTSPNMAKNK